MIDKKRIREVMDRVAAYPRPVLSLYINTNPARRESNSPRATGSPRALAMRAKSTLDALAVPHELAHRVVQLIENDVPRARTLALFAANGEVDLLRLGMELPIEDPTTGHAAGRWGEPYILPLLLALDEYEHCGVLYLDRDQWRLFAVTLDAIEEVDRSARPLSPAEWDTLQQSKQEHPAYIPSRGGAARDLADDHIEDMSRRFYQSLGGRLQQLLDGRERPYLVVVGPERDVARFRSALPSFADRIAAALPSLPNPDFSPSEMLDHVTDTLHALKTAREEQLIDDIGERGVTGLDACLGALQQGRLQILAVPWPLVDRHVYRELESGYVATSEAGARAMRSSENARTARMLLSDVLPGLAMAFNTPLEFIQGVPGARLVERFGGMGAIARW